MDRTAFAAFADRVAALLGAQLDGAQWRTEPDDTYRTGTVRLISDAGPGIRLTPHGDRIAARGVLPGDRRGPSAPEISVAARSAEHVAAHIRRRLMPKYEAALLQVREELAEREAEQAARSAAVACLARSLGAERRCEDFTADVHVSPGHRYERSTTVSRNRDWSPGQVCVRAGVAAYGESVSLHLTQLTPEQAGQVCALVRRISPCPSAALRRPGRARTSARPHPRIKEVRHGPAPPEASCRPAPADQPDDARRCPSRLVRRRLEGGGRLPAAPVRHAQRRSDGRPCRRRNRHHAWYRLRRVGRPGAQGRLVRRRPRAAPGDGRRRMDRPRLHRAGHVLPAPRPGRPRSVREGRGHGQALFGQPWRPALSIGRDR